MIKKVQQNLILILHSFFRFNLIIPLSLRIFFFRQLKNFKLQTIYFLKYFHQYILKLQTDRNFTLIHGAIRSKQQSLREAALDLFSEILKEIAQREQSYQDYLVKIYIDEIESKKKSKEEEYIHGNIMMIKILLTYAKQDIFSQNQIYDQGEYVLSKKDHKSSIINKAVIETLPILAKHAKHNAVQEFMEQSISFLLSQTKQARSVKDKSLPYMTLAMLILFLNENMLQDLIRKVILHI